MQISFYDSCFEVMFWLVWLEGIIGFLTHFVASNFNWLWWSELNYIFLNCVLGNWKYLWCLFTIARIEWHDFEIISFCNGIIINWGECGVIETILSYVGHVVSVGIIELKIGVEVVKLLSWCAWFLLDGQQEKFSKGGVRNSWACTDTCSQKIFGERKATKVQR